MRYMLILILAGLGAAAYIYLTPKTLKNGDVVPDFELETISGKPFSLDKYEDKILLVALFSIDDEESRIFFSDFHFIFDHFKSDPQIRFIAIASDGTAERVKLFLSHARFPGDVLLDDGFVVKEQFKCASFPMIYITNNTHEIIYTIKGFSREVIREIIPALRRAKKD
jgi:peroxiredoxin